MKSYNKKRGWIYHLVGGPSDGAEYRSGWLLPNGQRIPVDPQLTFKSGAKYILTQARWKTRTTNHDRDELRFTKDNEPYMQYEWIEGSGG
jgi:hypothetical protein